MRVSADCLCVVFFFSSRRRHTRLQGDGSSDVCSSDLVKTNQVFSSINRKQRFHWEECSTAQPLAVFHQRTFQTLPAADRPPRGVPEPRRGPPPARPLKLRAAVAVALA